MSDEPSDAQKLMAEVIATHRALFDGEACDACDWKFTNEYYGHDEHVAVEVDKAPWRTDAEMGCPLYR